MAQGKRVLVVDDNQDTVTTTVAMLQEMGYQDVTSMAQGWNAWVAAGGAVEG